MDLSRWRKHFVDSCYALQVQWDSSKARWMDSCLYYKWVDGWLVMMMSWIDDSAIVGQESNVMELKKALMNQFEWEDCGPMDEYVGCTIENSRQEESSLDRKFCCKATGTNRTFWIWRSSIPRLRLKLCLKSLTKVKKFSRPQNRRNIILVWGRKCTWCSIHSQIHMRDLARHMTSATQVHYDAMLRMMKYVDETSDSSSLVVKAIPTMQKIRRCERASLDTGSYWKVHLWCLRANCDNEWPSCAWDCL